MKINIVAVGKVKESYFLEGINEYSKRLSRFCKFNIIELQEENYQKVDDKLIEIIKNKEGERIIPNLQGKVFAMAIEGKKLSSEKLAEKIKSNVDSGEGVITFVIGGSYGLSEMVKEKADELISFSEMTFPHTLFRLMLTEQIYRAFSIINGSAYHK
ncbi:MAG: 23S rRNA (pseudouridine(1915)-N(3))-methyltransferase RlmH [Clostridia bacterium]|nr:23S rRNA (pseudouridine(1915)-N(3))-methyltransferase RlmH [Clostridia bacterium]